MFKQESVNSEKSNGVPKLNKVKTIGMATFHDMGLKPQAGGDSDGEEATPIVSDRVKGEICSHPQCK